MAAWNRDAPWLDAAIKEKSSMNGWGSHLMEYDKGPIANSNNLEPGSVKYWLMGVICLKEKTIQELNERIKQYEKRDINNAL